MPVPVPVPSEIFGSGKMPANFSIPTNIFINSCCVKNTLSSVILNKPSKLSCAGPIMGLLSAGLIIIFDTAAK